MLNGYNFTSSWDVKEKYISVQHSLLFSKLQILEMAKLHHVRGFPRIPQTQRQFSQNPGGETPLIFFQKVWIMTGVLLLLPNAWSRKVHSLIHNSPGTILLHRDVLKVESSDALHKLLEVHCVYTLQITGYV